MYAQHSDETGVAALASGRKYVFRLSTGAIVGWLNEYSDRDKNDSNNNSSNTVSTGSHSSLETASSSLSGSSDQVTPYSQNERAGRQLSYTISFSSVQSHYPNRSKGASFSVLGQASMPVVTLQGWIRKKGDDFVGAYKKRYWRQDGQFLRYFRVSTKVPAMSNSTHGTMVGTQSGNDELNVLDSRSFGGSSNSNSGNQRTSGSSSINQGIDLSGLGEIEMGAVDLRTVSRVEESKDNANNFKLFTPGRVFELKAVPDMETPAALSARHASLGQPEPPQMRTRKEWVDGINAWAKHFQQQAQGQHFQQRNTFAHDGSSTSEAARPGGGGNSAGSRRNATHQTLNGPSDRYYQH